MFLDDDGLYCVWSHLSAPRSKSGTDNDRERSLWGVLPWKWYEKHQSGSGGGWPLRAWYRSTSGDFWCSMAWYDSRDIFSDVDL
jgi:hypothetical protein